MLRHVLTVLHGQARIQGLRAQSLHAAPHLPRIRPKPASNLCLAVRQAVNEEAWTRIDLVMDVAEAPPARHTVLSAGAVCAYREQALVC